MKIRRPDEMQGLLALLQEQARDYQRRHQAFADVFDGFEYLKTRTPTDEGKEALQQCIRNLHVAFKDFEHEHFDFALQAVEETSDMFRQARRYIDTDD
jgi:hypothetical protein